MIKVFKVGSKSVLPTMDYNFEQYKYYLDILPLLTPKFDGNWNLLLNDFDLTDVNTILNESIIPDYVNLYILLRGDKYDRVIKENPKLYVKEKSTWEVYQELVAGLSVLIERRAMMDLYRAITHDIEEMKDALSKLTQLAIESGSGCITSSMVKENYSIQNHKYAKDVLYAFYTNRKYKWSVANKWLNDLGLSYAFHAMRRYIRKLLYDKKLYLQNKGSRMHESQNIDAPFISYAYYVIENLPSPKDFMLFLIALDKRDLHYVDLVKESQC